MPKPKEIKLRAFSLTQKTDITTNGCEIVTELQKIHNTTVVKDRMFKRSTDEDDKEHDLISSVNFDQGIVFGVMLRVDLDSNSTKIPAAFLESKSFALKDMQIDDNENTIYKNHYYFCFNNKYLVTTLPGNITITGFQTYINWLLNSAATPYELTPLCKSTPEVKLSDIQGVVLEDDSIMRMPGAASVTTIDDTKDKLIDVAVSSIKSFFNETVDITEEELKTVVSARLLLKLKKPKSMSEEEYQRKFGAILKPIAETANLHYISKNGQRINSDTLTVIKNVNIEKTEKGFLVEEQLRQAMISFLIEL